MTPSDDDKNDLSPRMLSTANGQLTNFRMDRELLPFGVNSMCVTYRHIILIFYVYGVTDTAIRQAYYYTVNILSGWGRQAGSGETCTFFCPFGWADDWMGGCMWPGHRALHYYLMIASTDNFALVLSWLDYVNSVLTGLPAYLAKRL